MSKSIDILKMSIYMKETAYIEFCIIFNWCKLYKFYFFVKVLCPFVTGDVIYDLISDDERMMIDMNAEIEYIHT